MTSRKQRLQFDCVRDLKARHIVNAYMRGYIARKQTKLIVRMSESNSQNPNSNGEKQQFRSI